MRTTLAVLFLLVGCGNPGSSPTEMLMSDCLMTTSVVLACTSPGTELEEDGKCADTARMAVAIPGCVDVETRAMSCVQDFFSHTDICADPIALSEGLQAHCSTVIVEGNTLHCPDFL
jgi:hypothetical protein